MVNQHIFNKVFLVIPVFGVGVVPFKITLSVGFEKIYCVRCCTSEVK